MSTEKDFIVSANLYSEEANDYIYNWAGGEFDSEEEGRDFWNNWWPDEEEVAQQAANWRYDHPDDNLELEIGLWDNRDDDWDFKDRALEFYVENVD